jgi:hemerythrin-like metal-binding protein
MLGQRVVRAAAKGRRAAPVGVYSLAEEAPIPAMKWLDEYSTGAKSIDDQHKTLFKMVADFRASLDEGLGGRVYGDLLNSLDIYARSHFGYEEGMMEQYHCPASEANKVAHARFADLLTGFQERYAKSGFVREDALALVDMLDRWLANHISRLDVQLKACLPGS